MLLCCLAIPMLSESVSYIIGYSTGGGYDLYARHDQQLIGIRF
jgi:hypothetical protein